MKEEAAATPNEVIFEKHDVIYHQMRFLKKQEQKNKS